MFVVFTSETLLLQVTQHNEMRMCMYIYIISC